jgi:hypothetical protein
MFAKQLHLLALENYMNNVHQQTMLLWDNFDNHFDIHYQECV